MRERLHRLLALLIKELHLQFRTPRSVLMLVMPVLLQTLLFPFVVTMDVTHCDVALLNEDGGAASLEMQQRIAATPYISSVTQVHSQGELHRLLDARRAMIAVHLPPDFSERLLRGETAPLQVICDGRRSNSSQIAAGYISRIALRLSAEMNGSSLQQADETAEGELLVRHVFNQELNYVWFIMPCLFGMIGMITSLNISAMALAREREEGTYEQLCVTPLSPLEILLGKTVPATLVVLAQCGIIWAMACWAYGVPFLGSPVALILAIAVYSLALTGIGFVISAFCATQQQAYVCMFCFIIPCILLSGFVAPAENMPDFMQPLARLDPLYYMILIARGIFLKGDGIIAILPSLSALAAIGISTLGTAYIVLRRRLS